MKNKWLILAAVLLVSAGGGIYALRGRQAGRWDGETTATPLEERSRFTTLDAERELIIHCGNSMRVAMEEIADEFQKRSGIGVVFNFGGSAELLPLIEFGGRGDLYICHDPYAEILEEKNLLVDYTVAGRLEPVILVQKGNPFGVKGLSGLGAGGMRVSSVDPRYATAGRMIHEVLDREPWGEEVRGNIVIESRGHSDAALALLTGHVDAALVWNFLAALYSEDLDSISTGMNFPEEIRVTLCRLTTSTNEKEAIEFMEFASSDFAKDVFERYGYAETGGYE